MFISSFIIILGLIVGSFLNVCVARLINAKDNILRSSKCPKCKQPIRWFDNIPLVSFLILAGKCRSCNKKISYIYPIVELLCAITFFYCYHNYNLSIALVLSLIFFSTLLVIFFTDFNYFLIFDVTSIPLIIIGLIASFLKINPFHSLIIDSVFGTIVGYGVIYLIRLIYFKIKKIEGMGLGDAKLLAAIGAWYGFKSILFILLFSSILGSVYGLSYIYFRNKKKNIKLAYGCFIVLAAFLYPIYGDIFSNFLNHPLIF